MRIRTYIAKHALHSGDASELITRELNDIRRRHGCSLSEHALILRLAVRVRQVDHIGSEEERTADDRIHGQKRMDADLADTNSLVCKRRPFIGIKSGPRWSVAASALPSMTSVC